MKGLDKQAVVFFSTFVIFLFSESFREEGDMVNVN